MVTIAWPPVALPEASSLALLIVGMAAVGVAARRRQARLLQSGPNAANGEPAAPGPADPN